MIVIKVLLNHIFFLYFIFNLDKWKCANMITVTFRLEKKKIKKKETCLRWAATTPTAEVVAN